MSQRDASDRPPRAGEGDGEGDGQAVTPGQPQPGAPAGAQAPRAEPVDRVVAEHSQGPGRSLQAAAARATAAKQQASQALGSAAASLRQQAGTLPGGQPVHQAARAVAGTLQNASQGLQQQHVGGMMQQLEQQVREQPLLSLGIAFLAGLILGRLSD